MRNHDIKKKFKKTHNKSNEERNTHNIHRDKAFKGNKKFLRKASAETVSICEDGFYMVGEKKIFIKESLDKAIENTITYKPTDTFNINNVKPRFNITNIEITDESTLGASKRIFEHYVATSSEKSDVTPSVASLNFSSAKNPGGGFLKGSQAQEESLARTSGLYPTLVQSSMYGTNRNLKNNCVYTDHFIYSPYVPVFRDDKTQDLLDPYYEISFISCPAVNAGVVLRRNQATETEVIEKMEHRMDRVLGSAVIHGHSHIILGAWGTGVFKNDPQAIAKSFYKLVATKYAGMFDTVVFAIYGSLFKKFHQYLSEAHQKFPGNVKITTLTFDEENQQQEESTTTE